MSVMISRLRHHGVAGPEMLEHGEDRREHEGDGEQLRDGLAEHQGDLHGQARHHRLSPRIPVLCYAYSVRI